MTDFIISDYLGVNHFGKLAKHTVSVVFFREVFYKGAAWKSF